MPVTDNLRRQHDVLEALAEELLASVDAIEAQENCYEISMQLAKLMAVLRLHLAQEDQSLYPRLMGSEVKETARTAHQFSSEMGGLAATAAAFYNRYSSSRKIAADFEEFRESLHRLIAALSERISRENSILYPMAEKEAARRSAA